MTARCHNHDSSGGRTAAWIVTVMPQRCSGCVVQLLAQGCIRFVVALRLLPYDTARVTQLGNDYHDDHRASDAAFAGHVWGVYTCLGLLSEARHRQPSVF